MKLPFLRTQHLISGAFIRPSMRFYELLGLYDVTNARSFQISIDLNKRSAELTGDHYFCYVDETASNTAELCGAGLLATTVDVRSEVISRALDKLKHDPDHHIPERKCMDSRTLQVRCFHASADSANAHSHLSNSIKSSVEGVFLCSLFDADFERRQMDYAGLSETEFQNSAWNLAADFAIFGGQRVDIFVEERQGLGSMGDTWIKAFRRRRDWEQFHLIGNPIPVVYPAMSCAPTPKSKPGLQVTDFLLWAAVREINGDSIWAKRVGLNRTCVFPHRAEGKGGLYVYSLGSRTFSLQLPKYGDDITKLLSANLPDGLDGQKEKYIGIEWFVCGCAKQRPDSAEHLASEVEECIELLADYRRCCSVQAIERLATVFLRLFDTVPAYSPELGLPQKDLRILFAARETAALAIRRDQAASRRLVADMSQFRHALLSSDPGRLPYNQIFAKRQQP